MVIRPPEETAGGALAPGTLEVGTSCVLRRAGRAPAAGSGTAGAEGGGGDGRDAARHGEGKSRGGGGGRERGKERVGHGRAGSRVMGHMRTGRSLVVGVGLVVRIAVDAGAGGGATGGGRKAPFGGPVAAEGERGREWVLLLDSCCFAYFDVFIFL